MQGKEKNEIYSIRKFKVGVGSALIGLSVLGATGLVNDVPIVSDVFGVETAHAAEGDTRTIEVTWLEAHSFKELGKNQATSVDNGDGTFTTTFTALPGHYAPKKVRLYQHEFSDKINVVAYDWLGSNVPEHDGPDNTKPSDFGLTDVFGKPTAYLINADQLDGKKMTPVFYFTPKSYADGSRGFMLARAIGTKSTTSEKVLKATTRYEKDDTREKGAENIVAVAAKDGKEVTTTNYVFRKKDGSVVEPMFNDAKVNPNDLNNINPDDYVTGKPKTTTEAPVNGVIKVAAKDKVVKKEIPSPVKHEADSEKDFGTPNVETKGKAGSEVTTIVYTVDAKTGNVTDKSTTTRTEPTGTVIKVGTKPKVVTKTDDQGRKVTETTTYTVDPTTGKVTPTTKTTYGEKANSVEKRVVPSPIRYEKDSTREKGAENITVKGKDGEDQITTTYKVDSVTGKVNKTVGQPVRTVEPTETVIKVASKDKTGVVTRGNKKFEVTTTYMVDPKTGSIAEKTSERELPNTDAENIDGDKKVPDKVVKPEVAKEKEVTPEKVVETNNSQGKDDKNVVTSKDDKTTSSKPTGNEIKEPTVEKKEVQSKIRYEKDVTREKGAENITVKSEDGETVIKVAAKDKVETIRQNGDTIERTTKYNVNLETGKVTEEVTDKLIASNGLGVKPSVAENNNVNENASVTDKPAHKDIVSSNGSDESGNVIKPLVNEKSEYKGAESSDDKEVKPPVVENNNTDENNSVSNKSENNGDVVKPLINEKPEFDLSILEKEPEKKLDVKTGLNDFGSKKETKKDDLNFIPVNEAKSSSDAKRSEKPVSEKPASQLPNTAGGNNMAINALGALTLTSVLGLAATKRKKED